MSFLKAVLKSTRLYVEFLSDQSRGVKRVDATCVQRSSSVRVIEGGVKTEYSCKTEAHLALRPGSGAIFIFPDAPDQKVPIVILKYKRKTGDLEFASEDTIETDSGRIEISFLWLVLRTLDWYERHGDAIPKEFPKKRLAPISDYKTRLTDGLSSEQKDAIELIYSENFAYIWGPPGTGKTSWVLAKIAKMSHEIGERILVLASTNIAVDNALAAIIENGIREEDVIRVGVPGALFEERFPKSCESSFAKEKVRELGDRVELLESEKQILERFPNLIDAANTLSKHESNLVETATEVDRLEAEIYELIKKQVSIEEEGKALNEQLESTEEKISVLGISELISERDDLNERVEKLENDRTGCQSARDRISREISEFGTLKKLFQKEKLAKLRVEFDRETKHLDAILYALGSVHSKIKEIEGRILPLQASFNDLTKSRDRLLRHREIKRSIYKKARDEELKLKTKLTTLSSERSRLELSLNELVGVCERRERIEESYAEGGQNPIDLVNEALEDARKLLSEYEIDFASRKVFGMTLDGFIGLTISGGIDVDRVFLDEGPYSPLAKFLPVLSLKRPVAILGDHKQLPPVCECSNSPQIGSFWGKSATFFEALHYQSWKSDADLKRLWEKGEPEYNQLKRADLTRSYRFGQSLARLLDKHVYKNGLVGRAAKDTTIKLIDCRPVEIQNRKRRQNRGEANQIVSDLDEFWKIHNARGREIPTIAVLAPYNNQVELIRFLVREKFSFEGIGEYVEILNTHKAQGREWDFVFFSVVDGSLPMNSPYFTDTNQDVGCQLVNTSLSRAKAELRLYLDLEYWSDSAREESLISDIARNQEQLAAIP